MLSDCLFGLIVYEGINTHLDMKYFSEIGEKAITIKIKLMSGELVLEKSLTIES